jgi:hypothetical protein
VNPPPVPLAAPPALVKVALPAVAVSLKMTMPNAFVTVALPAVELPWNRTSTLLVIVALSAVEVAPNFNAALLLKPALPAVALSSKVTSPVFVKTVKLPAVALPVKLIAVGPETKFWMIPELFVMPTPLMVKAKKGLEMVNGLAPALNTIPLTSVVCEMTGPLILEVANVAVSAGPLGGPLAIQLDALFQFVSTGVVFQVELPAKLLLVVASRRVKKAAPETMNPKFFFVFILVSMLS